MTEGYITHQSGNRMLIDGANFNRGLFFVKDGNKVTPYVNRKVAMDACVCGGMDGWATDEYEYNHPITGGPPEYHAGVSQSTKAPKEYPGATESDLHNSIAGIDEGELNNELKFNRADYVEHDGGPGSGRKGHTTQQPTAPAPTHGVRMTAVHPTGAGKRFHTSAGSHAEAMKHLQALRAHPETKGHNVTFERPSHGFVHTLRSHENEIPSYFFGRE
jgi:hypothetical protein